MYLDSPAKLIGEKRMTFRDLEWSSFKQIQQLLTERTHARFNFVDGILEITMPLESHERFARLIELFIRILVVELGLKLKTMGSTTLAREDLLKSAEPDNGYYIQNYSRVADHEIDLSVDPAPDLIVEVDITHTDVNKNLLYASLGVSEFWRFNGQAWQILCLTDGRYVEQDKSPTFPLVEKADLYKFLETALVDEVAAEVDFRQWVRQQLV
ncbi:Uma2 family endonuclease [Leptothoe spongobia]|uniref:Uma2 family endonuclease n=1 Tax=Leptothoe spongobia TAU-MAC 1115 TaxID=1967444 RepID=A0A947GM88_9CYAN|nr:Uma2 family endonuclease [Leptothoe spongobia]MBT9317517.1 Uma2 family endonuclease [Leptothoe spongobia TAU-MAC 1115]